MAILQKHIDFLIDRHAWFAALDNKPEGFGELFSTEWTRSIISVVVGKGVAHLTQVCMHHRPTCHILTGAQSHTLWDLQRDWEFALLEAAPASAKLVLSASIVAFRPHDMTCRPAQVEIIDKLLLERLQQPHSSKSVRSCMI
jgi:hypothetical protein